LGLGGVTDALGLGGDKQKKGGKGGGGGLPIVGGLPGGLTQDWAEP
jgi:hypothetical protein